MANPIAASDSRKKKSLSRAVDEILKLIAERKENSALLQEKLAVIKGDSSRLIPLIEQRVARLKREHLQQIITLAEAIGDPGFSPFLVAIGRLRQLGLDTRIKALHLLEQQGEKIDAELKSQLAAGRELLQRLKAALEQAGEKPPRSISPLMKQIASLTAEVQISLAVQLVEEEGAASFPLLSLWWGKKREVDRAFIELIAGIEGKSSADTLQKLEEKTSDKELLKLLKRGLFRLKTRGITPSKEARDKPYRLKLQPSIMEVAYGSQIDPYGGRLLMLARSSPPSGLKVCQAIVYDNYGIKQFRCSEMSKRAFRDVLRQVKEEDNLSMVELEPSYCQFLLDESYQLNLKTQNPAPAEYLQYKGWIGKPKKKYKLPLIYSHLPPQSVRGEDGLIPRSHELLQHEEFKFWLLSLEEIKEYIEEIDEAKRSRIILADHQKEFRLTTLLAEATNSYFSSQKIRYKRRLEEVALWLFLRGNEKEAELCVAVALAMEEREPSSIPFLFQLMERSIEFYQKQKEERRKEGTSLIIPP